MFRHQISLIFYNTCFSLDVYLNFTTWIMQQIQMKRQSKPKNSPLLLSMSKFLTGSSCLVVSTAVAKDMYSFVNCLAAFATGVSTAI